MAPLQAGPRSEENHNANPPFQMLEVEAHLQRDSANAQSKNLNEAVLVTETLAHLDELIWEIW